ncbi:hypothetical protein CCGE532_14745 [Rhizobium sp. CCGE532]|nr:hypothetical protein CCGE532_14745 [Rhizobium sp. CCGE532]
MKRVLIIAALTLCSATAGFSKGRCLTESDVQKYLKQHHMVATRCYWNTDTAQSEEEFQCVRTWVSPQKQYFSIEGGSDCLVNPRTFNQSEMKRLLRNKEPIPPCDTCG